MDNIEIEILADGRIKVTTDKVSSPNHMNADQFLKFIADLAGGETTRARRGHHHHGAETHDHDHETEGHKH